MTPKEKAKDLLDKFFQYIPAQEELEYEYAYAKQCALIAVDEMIANVVMIWGCNQARDEFRDYWHEVKQEIDKL